MRRVRHRGEALPLPQGLFRLRTIDLAALPSWPLVVVFPVIFAIVILLLRLVVRVLFFGFGFLFDRGLWLVDPIFGFGLCGCLLDDRVFW